MNQSEEESSLAEHIYEEVSKEYDEVEENMTTENIDADAYIYFTCEDDKIPNDKELQPTGSHPSVPNLLGIFEDLGAMNDQGHNIYDGIITMHMYRNMEKLIFSLVKIIINYSCLKCENLVDYCIYR